MLAYTAIYWKTLLITVPLNSSPPFTITSEVKFDWFYQCSKDLPEDTFKREKGAVSKLLIANAK